MNTLYKGVVDALRFISGEEWSQDKRIFYAHNVADTISLEDNEFILEVEAKQCSARPNVNDIIVLDKKTYLVKEVEEEGDKLKIRIEEPGLKK